MFYVYGIICHRLTNPLVYTVEKLAQSERNIIIIHVDAKTPPTEFELIKKRFNHFSYVIFIENRIDVRWGGFSQIETMLTLLKYASQYDYKYFSLISGDDIPLLSNEAMFNFLDQSYEFKKEFIGIENDNINYYNRINIKYSNLMFSKNRNLATKVLCKIIHSYRRFFQKLDTYSVPKLYKGAQWFTLTKQSISYIFDYLDANPNYINYFKHSFCGDELFFQTILYNSKFAKYIEKNKDESKMAKRYIDWKSGPDYPRTLSYRDFLAMKNSKMLFARKLEKQQSISELKEFFD